jgi:superoxide dismutase, Fe-Mn family
MNRKQFLASVIGASFLAKFTKAEAANKFYFDGQHTLPKLPYAYDALEPHIDKMTMEIHHSKHHQAYIDNLNKAVAGTEMESMSIDQLVRACTKDVKFNVRSNAGGHYNHSLFWETLAPGGVKLENNALSKAIESDLGGFEKFKRDMSSQAMGRFGSGWAWLIVTADKKLKLSTTPFQDNPLMQLQGVENGTPILGIDVWEHAYYLKYQNRRADYVKAFWNVVNWNKVSQLYDAAIK